MNTDERTICLFCISAFIGVHRCFSVVQRSLTLRPAVRFEQRLVQLVVELAGVLQRTTNSPAYARVVLDPFRFYVVENALGPW